VDAVSVGMTVGVSGERGCCVTRAANSEFEGMGMGIWENNAWEIWEYLGYHNRPAGMLPGPTYNSPT